MRRNNYSRTKKRQKIKKKYLIILLVFLISVISVLIGVVWSIKYTNNENYYASAQDTDEENNTDSPNTQENNVQANITKNAYGYLTLEEDPNAEDALEVYNRTEELLKGTIQYPVRTDGKKVVYLTFDDGPSTSNTPQILDILKANDVKATFFIMGNQLDTNDEYVKDILRREAKEGHAIANHTYSHNYDYLYPKRVISSNNFMADVEKCNDKLKEVLGDDFNTRVIRFPGGYWSWEGRSEVKTLIDQKGLSIINWNAINGDAEGIKNYTGLVNRLKQTTEDLGPNADSIVVLMHDTYGKEETVKALPEIINYYKSKGFIFKTIK